MVPVFLLFFRHLYPEPLLWSTLQLFMGKHGDRYVCRSSPCRADTSVWSDMLSISIKLQPNRAAQKSDLCQHFFVGFGANTVSFLWLAVGGRWTLSPPKLSGSAKTLGKNLRTWPWAWTYFLYPPKRIEQIFPDGISIQILWYLLKLSKNGLETVKADYELYLIVNTRWCCLLSASKPVQKSWKSEVHHSGHPLSPDWQWHSFFCRFMCSEMKSKII